jgi:membrane protein YdbS with pleckstrin-like domain
MSYEKPSRKAIGCMYVASFIGTAIVIVILTLLLQWAIPERLILVKYGVFGLIALLIINFLIGPIVRYNRYCYLINEECIDVKEGFIYIERHIVPIERLHNIEISKGPINRMFGMAEVKVTTAGSTVPIKFLQDKQAEFIVESLQKRINAVALEKKRFNIKTQNNENTACLDYKEEHSDAIKDQCIAQAAREE